MPALILLTYHARYCVCLLLFAIHADWSLIEAEDFPMAIIPNTISNL